MTTNQHLTEIVTHLVSFITSEVQGNVESKLNGIIQEAERLSRTPVDEYMHMDYFLEKYRISKHTFFKWKKLGYVHPKQVGRYKMYNVAQFHMIAMNRPQMGRPF